MTRQSMGRGACVVLLACFAVSFTACGKEDPPKTTSGGDPGGSLENCYSTLTVNVLRASDSGRLAGAYVEAEWTYSCGDTPAFGCTGGSADFCGTTDTNGQVSLTAQVGGGQDLCWHVRVTLGGFQTAYKYGINAPIGARNQGVYVYMTP